MWLSSWYAPASAQNLNTPPKVYFALAENSREPRQQALMKSLLEEVRQNLRTSAITSTIDELPKWSADEAVGLVPKEYSRYVVAYSQEQRESGFSDTVAMVIFEVGRLDDSRKLAFASASFPQLQVIIPPLSPNDGKPAEFRKYVDADWKYRPNSMIASEVVPWIRAMLPELEQKYLFYLDCTEATTTWTVADILSAQSDLDNTVSAFLHQLAQDLEDHVWQPPWRWVVAEMTGPASTKVICGARDTTLSSRAHYVLRESLADAQDVTDAGRGPIRGVSVKLTLEEQAWRVSYNAATPPSNAPRWNEEFFRRKFDAARSVVQDLGDMCVDNIGILTRNTQFVDSVARYFRIRAYGPRDGLPDANWKCRKSEK
jgi:hypothetical protein